MVQRRGPRHTQRLYANTCRRIESYRLSLRGGTILGSVPHPILLCPSEGGPPGSETGQSLQESSERGCAGAATLMAGEGVRAPSPDKKARLQPAARTEAFSTSRRFP